MNLAFNQTPERIKAEILAALEKRGADISTREGSYTNTLISEVSYRLWKLYEQFPGLLYMVFPDETSGQYIDMHAEQIGMVRDSGRKATVTIRISGTDGVRLPAGTALYAPASGLRFITLEDAVIADGTAAAQAQAAEVGAQYNLPAGSIISMYVNLPGVHSVTNDAAAVGGTDAESDKDFYARYHAQRALPLAAGNKNHYITWALETEGVSYASCVPLWNGNGTVKVIVAAADRGPVDEPVRLACAEHIEQQRPIGADVTVASVNRRDVQIAASITLADGFTAEQAAARLEASVNQLLRETEFGEVATIPYSRFLACLLQNEAVADYSAFTVDGLSVGSSITIGTEDAAKACVNITIGG